MTIISFNETHCTALTNLLLDYFPEVKADIPEDIIRGKLMDLICSQHSKGFLHIYLGFQSDTCIGFSICQIDTPESDWCKRPGWGLIREFYISPGHRRLGFGTALASYTEQSLAAFGAKDLYLTSDDGIPFWVRNGWHITDETASNGLPILEK